jgi:hypothetical protein
MTNMVGNIPYTPRVKKVLALASKEAKALNHSYVGTEHIFLGLLREGEGVAARVLKSLEVDPARTRNGFADSLRGRGSTAGGCAAGNLYPKRDDDPKPRIRNRRANRSGPGRGETGVLRWLRARLGSTATAGRTDDRRYRWRLCPSSSQGRFL